MRQILFHFFCSTILGSNIFHSVPQLLQPLNFECAYEYTFLEIYKRNSIFYLKLGTHFVEYLQHSPIARCSLKCFVPDWILDFCLGSDMFIVFRK